MTTKEVAQRLGIKPRQVTFWAQKLGLTAGPGRHLNLTDRHVRQIAYVIGTRGKKNKNEQT